VALEVGDVLKALLGRLLRTANWLVTRLAGLD